MKRGGGNLKHIKKPPRTPDPRAYKPPVSDDANEASKLHQKPCKFWKFGKCNWGWGCRFLHGNTLADDPRRPEYRGSAIDFTQFPRPMATSPHFSPQASIHTDDQSRVKQIRNPLVEIVVSGKQSFSVASTIKDACLRSSIDVLYYRSTQNDSFPQMTSEDAKTKINMKYSDFIIYVDFSAIILYPDSLSIAQQNITDVIHRRWDVLNNNLSPDQIELMSVSDFENVITKLTTLDNIQSTVSDLQNDTANIISSFSLDECRAGPPQLNSFRQKLIAFFGRLNLANSIIADMPLYANSAPIPGTVLQGFMPPPNGLSAPMQRVLSYTVGIYLTQMHVCLCHVNKLLNEFCMAPSCFAVANVSYNAMHPTPLCALPFSSMCTDEAQRLRVEFGRRLEPDVNVDMRTPYSITFREQNGIDSNPFNQFHQNPGNM